MLAYYLLLGAAAVDSPAVRDVPARDDAPITVTGERVSRTLRDTPSSVHVESRRELEARPADRLDQLLAFIPNVQLGDGSEGPAIRGQDTSGALQALPSFLGGNRPRMTIVVDGRPVTYNEFVFGAEPLWDVSQVEIFRSPQSTTQGQNSIAGAIFVRTADPTFQPEYRARAIGGDFKTRQLSALASGPVSDHVAFRIAGDFRYSRTTAHIADRAVGADPNHDVYGEVRSKLLIEPGALPGTRIMLAYAHQQTQSPQVVEVTEPFRKRRDESGFYGTFRIRVDSLTASVQHKSGALTTDLVATAGDSHVQRLAFPGLGQASIFGQDWSGEAVAHWQPAGSFEAVGGFSRKHVAQQQAIDLSALAGTPRFNDWQDGTGLFGEATVRLAQRLRVTGGLRYQSDRQRRIGGFEAAAGLIDLNYDRTFNAWLPKVSIAYDVTARLTAGAMVEKGYNPGGTTLRFDTGRPDDFEAERLWDYEVFVRSEAADGRLSLAANAFYYDMRNAQRSKDIIIQAPNGRPVGFADLFNVPRARSFGAEAEAEWRASARLSLRGGVGLLGTRIVDAGADYPEFQRKGFARSPHLTASAAVDWRPFQRLRLSADVRHHSRYSTDPAHPSLTSVGSGTIADARAQYDVGRMSLFGYASNLFDSFSLTSRTAFSATLEDPREVGVGVDVRF